ncbi:MAG TPA: hypothetical protein VKS79_21050 [Gemmataceae bacterium]|nr:hypothetical protein [Gemmataceae bacterium]
MRSLILLLAAANMAATALADPPETKTEKKTPNRWVDMLWVGQCEVGDIGPIISDPADGFRRPYKIYEVTGPKQVVIRTPKGDGGYVIFVIEGLDTAEMVTGREIDLHRQIFKVTRIGKRGSETAPVLEPESKEEREKREAHEKRMAEVAAKEKARVKELAEIKAKEEAEAKVKKAAETKRANELKDSKVLLDLAKDFTGAGKPDKAIERLKKIVKDYPDTPAAKEAAELLKKLEK